MRSRAQAASDRVASIARLKGQQVALTAVAHGADIGAQTQADGIVLAPIRTGVGLRLGANVGTMSYSRQRNLLPF